MSPDCQETPALHVPVEGAVDCDVVREHFPLYGGSGKRKEKEVTRTVSVRRAGAIRVHRYRGE